MDPSPKPYGSKSKTLKICYPPLREGREGGVLVESKRVGIGGVEGRIGEVEGGDKEQVGDRRGIGWGWEWRGRGEEEWKLSGR